VLDAAVPPELKSKPKKAMIAAVSTLAVGFALLLFVFVRNALRSAQSDAQTLGKMQALQSAWRRALGDSSKREQSTS
jgi:hypothetical protein